MRAVGKDRLEQNTRLFGARTNLEKAVWTRSKCYSPLIKPELNVRGTRNGKRAVVTNGDPDFRCGIHVIPVDNPGSVEQDIERRRNRVAEDECTEGHGIVRQEGLANLPVFVYMHKKCGSPAESGGIEWNGLRHDGPRRNRRNDALREDGNLIVHKNPCRKTHTVRGGRTHVVEIHLKPNLVTFINRIGRYCGGLIRKGKFCWRSIIHTP